MKTLNATYFAAASNMSRDQIQQLFSPIVPGKYVNVHNLVFSPSNNADEAIFRAIEALRQAVPSQDPKPAMVPSPEMLVVHG